MTQRPPRTFEGRAMVIHVLTHYCLSVLSGFLSILLGLFISTVDAVMCHQILLQDPGTDSPSCLECWLLRTHNIVPPGITLEGSCLNQNHVLGGREDHRQTPSKSPLPENPTDNGRLQLHAQSCHDIFIHIHMWDFFPRNVLGCIYP